MSKHFRYYFLLVMSLFCISGIGNAKETEKAMLACLQNKQAHESVLNPEQDNPKGHGIDAIHSNKRNAFCRLGGERNIPTAKEQSYNSFDVANNTFTVTGNAIYAAASFQSYPAHINSFIRSLLYPKHSFW